MNPDIKSQELNDTVIQEQSLPQITPKTQFNWRKMFLLLFGIFLVAGIGIGSYVLGVKQQQKLLNSKVIQQVVTPTPNPFANWQTYTNDIFHFSFRYPSGFILTPKIDTSNAGTVQYQMFFSTGKQIAHQADFSGFTIIVSKTNGKTIQQMFEKDQYTQVVPMPSVGGADEGALLKFPTGQSIAYRVGNSMFTILGFQNGNVLPDGSDNVMVYYTQILSSLVFTGDRANLQTYTDGTNFRIKYPSDWTMKIDSGINEFYNPNTMTKQTTNGGGVISIPTQFVNISTRNSSQTPKQYVDDLFTKVPYTGDHSVQATRQTILLNGLTAEVYMESGEGSQGYDIVVSHNNHLFIITIPSSYPSNDPVITQMLSSVELLN